MKNVVLLGSTGSIGTSTLKVADDLPDEIRIVGLAAGNNTELLSKQVQRYRPEAVSVIDPAKAEELEKTFGLSTRVYSGDEGLIQLATLPSAQIVLSMLSVVSRLLILLCCNHLRLLWDISRRLTKLFTWASVSICLMEKKCLRVKVPTTNLLIF